MFKIYKKIPTYRNKFCAENMWQYTQGKSFYNFLKEYWVRTLFFVEEKNGEPIIWTLCYKLNPYLCKFWGGNLSF